MVGNETDLSEALGAIRQVMNMFLFERILCSISALSSFCLFLFAAYKLFAVGTPDIQAMGIIFGASGISTAASGGISYYLNRSFNIIERLILGVVAPQSETMSSAE